MICPFCKAEIEENVQKCSHCGEWVNKILPEREFGRTVAFAFFFGIFGVHRFYTGYKKIGIIQLVLTLTLIGLIISGIWAFVDVIKISLNKYCDSLNRPLLNYKKNFGITIAIIASLLMLYNVSNAIDGWNSTNTTSSTSTNVKQSDNSGFVNAANGLELIEHHQCRSEFGTKAICGTILNNSRHDFKYVEVNINLYDAEGNMIDSELANVNDLESGKKWKFEAVITADKPVKEYKIKEISAW